MRKAVLLAVLPLTACTTDELALAPNTPNEPWAIPPSLGEPAPAAPAPADGATAGAASPPNAGRPKQSTDTTMSVSPRTGNDTGNFARGNAVSIDPRRQYDLAGLIDLAQRSNPSTREAWELARQAALAVGLVEASYAPQIAVEAIVGYQSTPLAVPTNVIPQGYFTTNSRELIPALTAKWLLFDFGKRAGEEQAARANSFVANVAFTGAHQKLIYEVSREYFALGAVRGRLRVAQQALKTAEIVQDAAEIRQARGLATVIELTQARRQTAQARFNLERATGDEHTGYAALIASMGIAPSARIEIMNSSELKLPAIPLGDVEQFIRDALANRPDIIAALGKIRAAEATMRSARASYYPTIALEAQAYENIGGFSTMGSPYYTINQPGLDVILKLSWPLYDGGSREADVANARSEVAAAQDSLDRARDVTAQQVTDAYNALHTSFAEYAAALALNDAAQTAYDAALDAYRHGVGTYTDVVISEASLTQAQSDKEDSHANVLTAAAALAFSTGAIVSQP